MTCSGTTCIKKASPVNEGVDREYNIKLYDNNGNQIGHEGGTYTVTQATSILPTISSLDESSFLATNSWQYLHINGSNLSNAVVYMDYDDGYGFREQTIGITSQTSSKITFKFKTTTSGSGTWRVKVKNSDGYSNYKTFTVGNTPVEDTQKPVVTILEDENTIAHTGSNLLIYTRVIDNKALKKLYVVSNGMQGNRNM